MPPLLFRGWLVVIGAFLVMMVGFGVSFSYAAIAGALEAEFGASRTAVSLVFAIGGFSTFTSSVFTGPLADRVGPRPVTMIGMVLVGLGLMTAATARSLSEIYLCYGLVIGLGIGFAYVPAVAAVQRWFVTWRGLASGIATAGIGFGTALVPAAIRALEAAADWRVALLVAGGGAILVGVTGALLLSSSPESRGLLPDGAAAPDSLPVPRVALEGEGLPGGALPAPILAALCRHTSRLDPGLPALRPPGAERRRMRACRPARRCPCSASSASPRLPGAAPVARWRTRSGARDLPGVLCGDCGAHARLGFRAD